MHQNIDAADELYWGGRRPQDLYMHALCEEWARDAAELHATCR